MKFLFLWILPCISLAQVSQSDFLQIKTDYLKFIQPFGEKAVESFHVDIDLVDRPGFMAYYHEDSQKIFVFRDVIDNSRMTKDSLAMLLCHEIGHNLNVSRFYLGGRLEYAFDHLEQDYFAASQCFVPLIESSEFLREDRQYLNYLSEIPIGYQADCSALANKKEEEYCLRKLIAAYQSIMGLFESFTHQIYEDLNLPDPNWSRPWLGAGDTIQGRLLNFINAAKGEDPLVAN